MDISVYRLVFVLIIAHIICFIIEVLRYRNNNWNLKHFVNNEMMTMSYFLLLIDAFILIAIVLFWALQPIIK